MIMIIIIPMATVRMIGIQRITLLISFGKFSLAGIGLASIVGVVLNLILPDKKSAESES